MDTIVLQSFMLPEYFPARAITELEHHDVNIIIKNRYMQSMRKRFSGSKGLHEVQIFRKGEVLNSHGVFRQ